MHGSGAVSNLGEVVVQDTGIEGDSQRFLSDTSLSSKIYVQARRQEGAVRVGSSRVWPQAAFWVGG